MRMQVAFLISNHGPVASSRCWRIRTVHHYYMGSLFPISFALFGSFFVYEIINIPGSTYQTYGWILLNLLKVGLVWINCELFVVKHFCSWLIRHWCWPLCGTVSCHTILSSCHMQHLHFLISIFPKYCFSVTWHFSATCQFLLLCCFEVWFQFWPLHDLIRFYFSKDKHAIVTFWLIGCQSETEFMVDVVMQFELGLWNRQLDPLSFNWFGEDQFLTINYSILL